MRFAGYSRGAAERKILSEFGVKYNSYLPDLWVGYEPFFGIPKRRKMIECFCRSAWYDSISAAGCITSLEIAYTYHVLFSIIPIR